MEYTIDAKGKTLGRVASQAASILMGKNKASFEKHKISGNKVFIENASKIKLDAKKAEAVLHERYSGYPGGLKLQSIKEILSKKGYGEIFRLAIYGMLPDNKLRKKIIFNLKVKE